jgi:hypothetical protein
MIKSYKVYYHITMSITSLSIRDIFVNISNAFIGLIADIGNYSDQKDQSIKNDAENDQMIRLLFKENRYMYLALLILLLMIVSNILYSSD